MWCESYVYIRMTYAVSRNSSTKQVIYGCYQLTSLRPPSRRIKNNYLWIQVCSFGPYSRKLALVLLGNSFIKILFFPERSGSGPRIQYSVIIATHIQYMYLWIYKHGGRRDGIWSGILSGYADDRAGVLVRGAAEGLSAGGHGGQRALLQPGLSDRVPRR